HGIAFTRTLVLLYTVLLLAVCLLPYLVGMSGVFYLVGSLVLNLQFLRHAWRLKFAPRADTAIRTFRFSITHLMLLFLVLLADHYL
ncbi:MAG TPA: protoheme IX farnesyltransferase, partial [Thauera sp.]|nr:protoheme IX farnesyltransferase [Thauera sp.]